MPPSPDTVAAGWDCHVHVFDAGAAVQPGHYVPATAPLEEVEALAARHGVGHLVLVQPSVYGVDNTVLLRALARQPGRHRGVAVVDPAVGDDELERLHAAGVCGVRFNLVSPAGHTGGPDTVAADLRRLAPRLHRRGWHVQWYVTAQALPRLVAWQAETGLRFVLDHLAGLTADLAPADPAWTAVQALARGGAWIKLSGWYRLRESPPYARLQGHVQRLLPMFGARVVWGSDWPHTSFAPAQRPDYGATLQPVRDALSDAAPGAAVGTTVGTTVADTAGASVGTSLGRLLIEQAAALYAPAGAKG